MTRDQQKLSLPFAWMPNDMKFLAKYIFVQAVHQPYKGEK